MKRKYRVILWLLLIIAVTLFIFSNSMKGKEASTRDSNFVIEMIEAIFGESNLNLHVLVRKGAHMAEFAALGFLVTGLIRMLQTPKSYLGYGLFYVLSVAVTDEFIQNFTGRSSMVQDVLIDFFGGILGVLAMIFLAEMIKLKKRKNSGVN